ncbi:hypothetical protein MRB53_033565 [Persea americana]|uniref:Uncharacterized protein n=1 Tax=Persea americana TaxID=3435 RepID=A0ACC2KV57_PERAE|nr:hypothetical protein MRB53_033565 [Persea americana]
MVHESEKMPRLRKMLNQLGEKSTIVFVNNRKYADTLSKALNKAGYRVTTLHRGKSQIQREISLEGFKSKRFTPLVATDVMGRGIDVQDVAHVIYYGMPRSTRIRICSGWRRRRGTTVSLVDKGSKTLLIHYSPCVVADWKKGQGLFPCCRTRTGERRRGPRRGRKALLPPPHRCMKRLPVCRRFPSLLAFNCFWRRQRNPSRELIRVFGKFI